MELAVPKFKRTFKKILERVVEEINTLNLKESLNKKVDSTTKRRILNKIQDWRRQGILTGYFEYLVNSTTRYTLAEVIRILVYGCYYEYFSEHKKLSYDVFKNVGIDCVAQLNKETQRKYEYDWSIVIPFLVVPVVEITYDEYLLILYNLDAEEVIKKISLAVTEEVAVTDRLVENFIDKQTNRIVCVSNGKFSGSLNETSHSLFNQLYVHYLQDDKVIFIAELDGKTTEMCKSLDGQIFNVSGINSFKRYSDLKGGLIHIEIKGLKPGVNLPPINDHFHWCRSSIKYTAN